MVMKESSGLAIEDAQRAICKGTLGAGHKEWTSEERKTACLRSNEVYESNVGVDSAYLNIALIAIGVLFVAGIVMLYLNLKRGKSIPVKNVKSRSRYK